MQSSTACCWVKSKSYGKAIITRPAYKTLVRMRREAVQGLVIGMLQKFSLDDFVTLDVFSFPRIFLFSIFQRAHITFPKQKAIIK